jgi:3-oxoacyl-[acyl-carrier-protein] synthase-3
MVLAHFKNAEIKAIVSIVPEKEISLDDELQYYNNDINKVNRIKKQIGINKRRVVNKDTTTADLGFYAVKKLLEDTKTKVENIDAIIFVCQYPDYINPGNSSLIHGWLNFPTKCLAFDINQGCAGYTYGIYLAYSLISAGGCKNIVLITAETPSKYIDINNRSIAPILADAASASLISNCENNPSYFSINADGSGFNNIILPSGGGRIPINNETLNQLKNKDIFMNGLEVFNFTLSQVPKDIINLMKYANKTAQDFDYLVLHQANKQIMQNIALQSGFSKEQTLINALESYANTASCSIPIAINFDLSSNSANANLILCGYGIGLSWASCIVHLNSVYLSKIYNYQKTPKPYSISLNSTKEAIDYFNNLIN